MKSIYLILTIIGSVLPWSFLLGFFLKEGLAIDLFFQYIFTNSVASAVAADLLISATVFLCFAFSELKRLGISGRWLFLYIFATFAVGLSCSLPLFLYFKEQAIAPKSITETSN